MIKTKGKGQGFGTFKRSWHIIKEVAKNLS